MCEKGETEVSAVRQKLRKEGDIITRLESPLTADAGTIKS
jgi:hypothetical protein